MDEQAVREAAEDHAEGTVQGDLRRAGGYLTPEAMAQAKGVMDAFPNPVTSGAVEDITSEGPDYIVRIRYAGDDKEVTVESRWAERDGSPKLFDMKVL